LPAAYSGEDGIVDRVEKGDEVDEDSILFHRRREQCSDGKRAIVVPESESFKGGKECSAVNR
jgi:hypothetical protein